MFTVWWFTTGSDICRGKVIQVVYMFTLRTVCHKYSLPVQKIIDTKRLSKISPTRRETNSHKTKSLMDGKVLYSDKYMPVNTQRLFKFVYII